MNANEAIAYIHSVFWKGSIPGLSRTQELLRLLGNPEKKLKFVHIAGTNGKGSTAAMTASILQKAGYRVGLYTSPYIYRFNERIQVDGEQIPDEAVCELTEFIRPHAEAMADETGEHPTEFELMTAVAFEHFARSECDIVVCEVGLGGRLDSTNIIDPPEACVITRIGLDHTEFLGDTPAKVAAEKAGIIKKSIPVVVGERCEEYNAVIETVAAEMKSQFRNTGCMCMGFQMGLPSALYFRVGSNSFSHR